MDYTSREYWNGIIKMSLSKFFILRVLYTQSMHGYEIARTVAEVTNGCCTPSEGTIYPVLREFEEGGYVTAETVTANGRERKVYTLTGKGRVAFKVAVEAWKEVTEYVAQALETPWPAQPDVENERGKLRTQDIQRPVRRQDNV